MIYERILPGLDLHYLFTDPAHNIITADTGSTVDDLYDLYDLYDLPGT